MKTKSIASITILMVLSILFLMITQVQAQYDAVFEIELPDKFKGMEEIELIYSNPNPNFAELVPNSDQVAWKHRTTIKAPVELTILEMGAYLLYNGEWMLRMSAPPKKIKELFAIKSLHLAAGDSCVFLDNNRYDSYTQTGWNFWYAIAQDAKGTRYFGYEILETKGITIHGEQVLPLTNTDSTFVWSGKAAKNDYRLSGTLLPSEGRLVTKGGKVVGGKVAFALQSLDAGDAQLQEHLLSKDFFFAKKYGTITYEIDTIDYLEGNACNLYGTLTLLGNTKPEKVEATIAETDSLYAITVKAKVNRVQYGMLYSSSVDTDPDHQGIADFLWLEGTVYFKKDYPGSMPWNTATP